MRLEPSDIKNLELAAEEPREAEFLLPGHDLHNHTVYCGHADANATVLNLLSRASSLHLQYLGISEHIGGEEDLAAYRRLTEEVRTFDSMGARVLVGVEMDVDPEDAEGRWAVPDIECDYVILSAHGFPQFDLEIPESDKLLAPHLQRQHLAAKWLTWYGKAIERGGCHILGHPLREPLAMNLIDLMDMQTMDQCVALFRPAIDHGIAFELNDSFLTALVASSQIDPYLELIWRLKRLGMRFSRGSDSHGLLKVGAADAIAMAAQSADVKQGDWIDAGALHRPR